MESDRTRAEKMLKRYESIWDASMQPEVILGKRLLDSNPFDSDEDLRKAIYYLTDEDYANERHAIIFFASKLV